MSMLTVSLHDAATNCARDGAIAVLSLRGGVQIEGLLEKPNGNLYVEGATVHVKTANGGWATVLVSEIAAVEASPK